MAQHNSYYNEPSGPPWAVAEDDCHLNSAGHGGGGGGVEFVQQQAGKGGISGAPFATYDGPAAAAAPYDFYGGGSDDDSGLAAGGRARVPQAHLKRREITAKPAGFDAATYRESLARRDAITAARRTAAAASGTPFGLHDDGEARAAWAREGHGGGAGGGGGAATARSRQHHKLPEKIGALPCNTVDGADGSSGASAAAAAAAAMMEPFDASIYREALAHNAAMHESALARKWGAAVAAGGNSGAGCPFATISAEASQQAWARRPGSEYVPKAAAKAGALEKIGAQPHAADVYARERADHARTAREATARAFHGAGDILAAGGAAGAAAAAHGGGGGGGDGSCCFGR